MPLFGAVSNRDILNAIQNLAKEVQAMSDTQSKINTDVATIQADVSKINTAVTAIQAEIATLKAANPAIDTTALDAAVAQLTTATAGVAAIPNPGTTG